MKYSKPSMEIEAFDVLDVITASGVVVKPQDPSFEGGEGLELGGDSLGNFDFQGEFVF